MCDLHCLNMVKKVSWCFTHALFKMLHASACAKKQDFIKRLRQIELVDWRESSYIIEYLHELNKSSNRKNQDKMVI